MDALRNWVAAVAAAAGLGAAIVTASAVVSADPGTTTVGPTLEAPSHSDGDSQSQRRRATFSGGSITEVKPTDLDPNGAKK